MRFNIFVTVAMLTVALGSLKAYAAPDICVEETRWSALEIDDQEDLYQVAAYQCKELGVLDQKVENAIATVDTVGAFSLCTGQVEVTVLLAAARTVLGVTKMTIRNLPCEDTPEKTAAKAKAAACSVFVTRGIPCKG